MTNHFPSLSDIENALTDLPKPNAEYAQKAQARQDELTKPQGSLGKLEEIAVFMASWAEVEKPEIHRAQVAIFAGNHGVTAQNISPFPPDVTALMVQNFQDGGAAINQLAKANGAEFSVFPIALENPTRDFTQEPAMQEDELLAAINIGAQAVQNVDILIVGEMGIGNSTAAAALACASFGGQAQDWVGPGTGLDAKGVSHKAQIIDGAFETHKNQLNTAFDIAAIFGGRELAAIFGAVLKARQLRIPVLVDGYIASAALAPFARYEGFFDHCLFSHKSAEPGHIRLLEAMGQEPILDMNMRLGEGSGAALALGIVRSALACHNGMKTFAEAGIG